MVQKVVGSIPITHPISECSTAVSIQVFQTWDESSILSTRTKLKNKDVYVLFFNCPYEKDHVVGLLAPGYKKKSIYALIFYDCLYEKICETKLFTSIYKKKLLTSFSLLEEGEIDDSADQCTEDTHGDEGKD